MSFYCPRRDDRLSFAGYSPIFKADREGEDQWREDGTCSYCGSITPDALFEAIERGDKIGPTDKGYKVYVDPGKFYFQHLDDAGRTRLVELINDDKISFGVPGHLYVLPYFTKAEA